VVALSQLIDDLKVGFLFTYLATLAFVIITAMVKEGYDEYVRYNQDQEINCQIYKVFADTSVKINQPSSALKVGDIIEIKADQRIPADLLLLATLNESGEVLIRTDQVDGERQLKARKPIKYTQRMMEEGRRLFWY